MRYLKLFALFLKRSLMLGLEYRANLIGGLLASAFDGIWSFAAALMLYSFRDTIGGWNFYETLVVVGMLFVSAGFLYVFVWPNMQSIVEHIRTGTMDFILTKPLNSQWHATFNYFKLESASSIVAGAALMAYALVQLRVSPNLGQIILFIALVLGGLVILYAILTIMVVFSFWAVETGEVMQLIYLLLETGRYPAPTLPQPMRAILTFIIPIAFITTVPAEVLLGKVTSAWVGWCWVFAAGLLFASTQFWKFGVRRYNSASS